MAKIAKHTYQKEFGDISHSTFYRGWDSRFEAPLFLHKREHHWYPIAPPHYKSNKSVGEYSSENTARLPIDEQLTVLYED